MQTVIEWIPATDRLPDGGQRKDYLVSLEWNSTDERLPEGLEKKRYMVYLDKGDQTHIVTLSHYLPKQKRFHFDMHHIGWRVTHWAEIPKPVTYAERI